MRATFRNLTRIVLTGLVVIVVILIFAGCGYFSKSRKAEEVEPSPAPGEKKPWSMPGKRPSQPGQPEPSYYVHTVKRQGETISIIAAWYTGSIDNWKELAAANPNLNPDRIYVGNKIRIPEYLMKTQDPMPEDFLWNFMPKPKKAPPSKPAATKQTEEPELFGPKEYPPTK